MTSLFFNLMIQDVPYRVEISNDQTLLPLSPPQWSEFALAHIWPHLPGDLSFSRWQFTLLANDIAPYLPSPSQASGWRCTLSTFSPPALLGGQNRCWLNALFQVMNLDPDLRAWALNQPSTLMQTLALLFKEAQNPSFSTECLRQELVSLYGCSPTEQQDPSEWLLNLANGYTPTRHEIETIEDESQESKVSRPVFNLLSLFFDTSSSEETLSTQTLLDNWITRIENGKIYLHTLDPSPSSLWLQLPRFSYDPINQRPIKLTHQVTLERTLRFQGSTYRLMGVICHEGSTPQRGHYIAFVRRDNYWKRCNDETIENASPLEKSKRAYLLYYQKVEDTTPQEETYGQQKEEEVSFSFTQSFDENSLDTRSRKRLIYCDEKERSSPIFPDEDFVIIRTLNTDMDPNPDPEPRSEF